MFRSRFRSDGVAGDYFGLNAADHRVTAPVCVKNLIKLTCRAQCLFALLLAGERDWRREVLAVDRGDEYQHGEVVHDSTSGVNTNSIYMVANRQITPIRSQIKSRIGLPLQFCQFLLVLANLMGRQSKIF